MLISIKNSTCIRSLLYLLYKELMNTLAYRITVNRLVPFAQYLLIFMLCKQRDAGYGLISVKHYLFKYPLVVLCHPPDSSLLKEIGCVFNPMVKIDLLPQING